MSHGARSLYACIKRRYILKFHNNGKLHVSQEEAVLETGSDKKETQRWFRENQYYGFIVQTAAGSLGVDGAGKSPHWRLTELGYMRDPPTRDFLKWNGVKFNDDGNETFDGSSIATRRKSTAKRRPNSKVDRRNGNIEKHIFSDWLSQREVPYVPTDDCDVFDNVSGAAS